MTHIDPWLIYVLSIGDGVKCFTWILFVVLIVLTAILGIKSLNSYDIINYDDKISHSTKEMYKKSFKVTRKYFIITLIIFILDIFMIVLVPSKGTIQEMIDAAYGINPKPAIIAEDKDTSDQNNGEIKIIISQ